MLVATGYSDSYMYVSASILQPGMTVACLMYVWISHGKAANWILFTYECSRTMILNFGCTHPLVVWYTLSGDGVLERPEFSVTVKIINSVKLVCSISIGK
jgi:hypothetical protein